MAVLPKGGLNIAGHKVPWEAIAAVAGVAGVILVLRARSQGQQVAAVGQAPATAASAGFGANGFAPDMSGALANISQQLTSLSQGVNTPAAATPATVPFAAENPTGGLIPVYSYDKGHQGILGYLQSGQAFTPTGQGFGFTSGEPGYLVNYGGVPGFIEGSQTALNQQIPVTH